MKYEKSLYIKHKLFCFKVVFPVSHGDICGTIDFIFRSPSVKIS